MSNAQPNSEFRKDVEKWMAKVPAGKVTTYGDLAALAGHPYAARVVGESHTMATKSCRGTV